MPPRRSITAAVHISERARPRVRRHSVPRAGEKRFLRKRPILSEGKIDLNALRAKVKRFVSSAFSNILLERETLIKAGICAALMILFTLLQTTIFSSLRPFGAVPDMMLSAVIAIAVSEGEKWGAVCGLISSLLISSVGTTGFSVIPLVYMLTGYISGLLQPLLPQTKRRDTAYIPALRGTPRGGDSYDAACAYGVLFTYRGAQGNASSEYFSTSPSRRRSGGGLDIAESLSTEPPVPSALIHLPIYDRINLRKKSRDK